MRKRNILNSSPGILELKKRRNRSVLNKILIFLFGFAVIFILLAYLSRINSLNIDSVEIIGNKVVDTQTITEAVKEQIAGKYLWLFPKTNILFYPQGAVKKELQNKFKRIKDVNLSIKNNKVLEVSLSERTASYTWCGVESPESLLVEDSTSKDSGEDQKCYFMDLDGYIFDEAPYFSGNIYFKFYGLLDLNANDPLGFYFAEQNFKQLISFKNILTEMKLKPVALRIINNEDAEMILLRGTRAATEPKIIFKMNADVQNIAENLQAALNTEPLQSKFKTKYSLLQYIDLRFNNKVYDKFQ